MSTGTGTPGKGKGKLKVDAEPFQPRDMEITTMCFVSNQEKLEEYNACVMRGHMKDLKGKKVNVTELPKTFFDLQNDKEVKEVFRKIQMEDYFSLLPWGGDYQRSYELMTTLNMEGHAIVTNLEDKKVQIEVTT